MSYVGVSGVVGGEQQGQLELLWRNAGEASQRDLLVGIKATEKSQWHDAPNKYGENWYPVGEAITDAYEPVGDTVPALQIYLGAQANSPEAAIGFLKKLDNRTNHWGDRTFQLDKFPWMEDKNRAVLDYIQRIRGFGGQTILQAYGEYMDRYHPYELMNRLKHLKADGMVEYVLYDASHGTGKTMDTEALRPFIGTTKEVFGEDLGVVVAGGLDAETIKEKLPPLLDEFPDLSWDAEGKLHYGGGERGGALKLEAASEYLQASAEVLRISRR